jgi:general secretion pathway protein I
VRQRGFTLLEVLVATALMAIAVSGLLANLSTSLSTAARLTDYDRAALVARRKMDELLTEKRLPRNVPIEGPLNLPGLEGGWRAVVRPYETLPAPAPGQRMLERIQLEVWWQAAGGRKRTIALETFRQGILLPADMAALGAPIQ